MALTIGDTAPDFDLPNHRRGRTRLSDFRGRKNVVLGFHPMAFTPVCAAQMQAYETDIKKFESADTVVFGVSTDTQPSKAAWAKELGVSSFDLLSDNYPYGAVAQQYGVFDERDGIAHRAVFVIDKNGTIVWSKVYDMAHQPATEEIFGVLGIS